jgi:hypothetical protein
VTDSTATPARAPFSIDTDLTVTIDGTRADVESTGERLFVEFRSVPDAVRAAGGASDGTGQGLATLLTVTDLTVEFRVRDRTVLLAGVGARPGVVSRTLGVAPSELRLGGVFGSVGAEIRAGVDAVSRMLE